jgi:hypothetical protein
MSDAVQYLRDNYEFTDIGDLNRALAQAWDEGKEALAAAILPDAAPLINPYREGSDS